MKTENLPIKAIAIAKATTFSVNGVQGIIDSGHSRMNGIDLKELREAIQWAIDERTNNILATLRTFLEQDMTAPKDEKHKYGFELAIDMINDNFFE